MRLGLDRSLAALAALGKPHEGLDAIVVAGSNGKGSVAAMLDRIGRQAGLSTGLYTSPHLVRYNERIRLSGVPIADDAFEEALERVFREAPEELTFFETLTMAAFVAFRDARVDLAILEVGLGGRLDATNVVPSPLATAIVSITSGADGRFLEHADLLGNTVRDIAGEKAGIFRAGVPAILGPLETEAREAIVTRAERVGAAPLWEIAWEPLSVAEGPRVGPSQVATLAQLDDSALLMLPDSKRVLIAPALLGRHQLANGAVAAATAWLAARRIPALGPEIETGIRLATWPGRLERVYLASSDITVWLDCAHNLEGARALVLAAPAVGISEPTRTTLVFGALADKAYEPFLRLVAPLASRRFYAEPQGRAPAPLAELVQIASGEAVGDPIRALTLAIASTDRGGIVLVTGSIYLVGELRAHLFGERRDPPIAL